MHQTSPPLTQIYCHNLSLKGLMSPRPGCFGHLQQSCQPGSQHFLHGSIFPKSFRSRSMQGKGNSGILQVKQCPVSKMTAPLQLLLMHSALPHWTEKSHPGPGGRFGEEVQPEVWASIWKVTPSLVKLWGQFTAWPAGKPLSLLSLFSCVS